MEAMKYVTKKSKKLSDAAYPSLKSKIERMGYSEEQLKRTLRYIRDEAPIIIHVDLSNVLQFFNKDTHYRNQFETNSSRGTLSHSTRREWEGRIFDNIYEKRSSGFDRVKYGVLNIVNDPYGINSCIYYGDSYLILKKVRLRTSFANKDSSYNDVILACCEYYCHVMNSFNNGELEATMEVGIKTEKDPTFHRLSSSIDMSYYKEIQIHGPIKFDEHIAGIRLNIRHKGSTRDITLFCQKNGITDVSFQDGTPFLFD